MFEMAKVEESTSSIPKTNVKRPYIQGTRLSLRNAQLLISSGVCTIDNLLGGGLPIGTIYCIEEDISRIYSDLILKHFLAEGVLNGHNLVLASKDCEPEEIINELPCPVADGPYASYGNQSKDQMKIAWRYENLNTADTMSSKSAFNHVYDTSKVMDSEKLKSSTVHCWNSPLYTSQLNESSLGPYLDLLTFIQEKLEEANSKVDPISPRKNVTRIALHSLCSPLWTETSDRHSSHSPSKPQFLKFIYCLKSILRSSYAVCVVTVPAHLFQEPCTIQRLRHTVDVSAQLKSFADSEEATNEVYREYAGLFHFKKLFSINTIVPHSSESLDLAFKLRRKRFSVEKLCLPPDLGSGGDIGCSSNILHQKSSQGKGGCCGSLEF